MIVTKKEVKMEDLIVPPDPERVMVGLRDTGYNFNTAIADILDNSIAANATTIKIKLDLNPKNELTVYIADNGIGMDEEGLLNAMKYGSKQRDDPSSLGKFGLGLKTSSTSFCRCLSVISRGKSDDMVRKVQWDLDYIAKTNEWKLKRLEVNEDELEIIDDITEGNSGTLVVWEKIDRLLKSYQTKKGLQNALRKVIEKLKFHISMVYQRFIDPQDNRARNIDIFINDCKVFAWDPFCINEPDTQLLAKDHVAVEMPNGKQSAFTLKAYLLPRRENFSTPNARDIAKISNDMQGFYVYRENRLIHYSDWLGMFQSEPHFSLLRVEFSFDYTLDDVFNVDIKKSRILLNEDIFSYLQDNFMRAPRREAEERYRKGTNKKVAKKGRDAHEISNKTIDEKANGLEESKTTIIGEDKVQLENKNGKFTHKITIKSSVERGQYRIVPVEMLEDGQLWNPCIVEGRHAVQLNQSHPYYKKIYYPVLQQNVMVTGMDALLWALGEAELSTFSNDTKEQYEDMRIQVSRFLKKLLVDLPEPDTEDEEE